MSKSLTGKTNDFLKIVLPACASGKLNAVRGYVDDQRKFVQWIGPHGRTMLWEAARKGKTDVVKYLAQDQGADATAIGCYYRETRVEVSPWLIATINKRLKTTEYLESIDAGIDFNSACYLGDETFVQSVLKVQPDVANTPFVREHRWNGYIVWPLQYAIAGRSTAIVNRLINAQADVSASRQILFDAIDTGQTEICEQLLAAGADPIQTQHRGWYEDPQFNNMARRFGHQIAERDAPPEKWPAIVDACRGNHNAPDDRQRVLRLINSGVDIDTRDYKGKTGLHRAAQAGFKKIAGLLLERGANIEATSDQAETPLFDAAFYGRHDLVGLLLQSGANIEARNIKEETPLFAAVRGGQAAALQTLIDAGADLDAVNAKGQDIADVARRSNKTGIDVVRQTLRSNGHAL